MILRWIHASYLLNGPLQPYYYLLASHTTHIVCVNFIREWWDLQFNLDSERQIFEKLSWQVCLLYKHASTHSINFSHTEMRA